MKTMVAALTLLVAAAATPSPAFAQSATGPSDIVSERDTKFLVEAIQGGLAEVELGRLAIQKAGNPEVKAFGQRMVDDHSAANAKLMAIAEGQKVTAQGTKGTAPLEPSAEAQAMARELSGLSGAEFDRTYTRHMVQDHEKDVAAFGREASEGEHRPLRMLAKETLPTLEEHLRLARALAQHVQASR